jgi:hypothetical protein
MFKIAYVKFYHIHDHGAPIKYEDFIGTREIIQPILTANSDTTPHAEISEQLVPLGLALLANYYNQKQDQYCSIYAASAEDDVRSAVQKINSCVHDAKAIIILHPVDCNEAWHAKFPPYHRTVIYIEKRNGILHVLHADSAASPSFTEYCLYLVSPILSKSGGVFYSQQAIPSLKSTESNTPLLQCTYYQCGTHAFRIARSIAKNPNFLDSLQLTDLSGSTEKVRFVGYKLPISFAKNAGTKLTRNALANLYGAEFTPLAKHFTKYPGKHDYVKKFADKYLRITRELYDNSTQEDLIKQIDQGNARNMVASVSKPRLIAKL